MLPNFDDDNRTVVIGSPGGTVVLDCRISMLQDYTVSYYTLFLFIPLVHTVIIHRISSLEFIAYTYLWLNNFMSSFWNHH